ncbi:hypothetical protein [Microcoleus vaginatus]|uniref:hypothetical protein n=1 Tax=Microcoleus vaginatus TaxID=119532 RepID=UPI00403F0116
MMPKLSPIALVERVKFCAPWGLGRGYVCGYLGRYFSVAGDRRWNIRISQRYRRAEICDLTHS